MKLKESDLKKWVNSAYLDAVTYGVGYIELPSVYLSFNTVEDPAEDEYPETTEWLDVIYNDRMVQINEKGKIREKKKDKNTRR